MIDLRKYLRLLPAIVLVGGGLLAIKGVDLARAAQASVATGSDNSGLAPADTGGAKPNNDFAADTDAAASSGEVDVLTSLTRRRAQLDARERALNMRENLLSAGEGRVDQKIASLKSLQTQIQGLLTQRDAAQDKQIASLVKTYSSMKAKDAAHIFDTLADDVLVPVAKGMKSDVLAPVLGAMNREAAQRLTVRLASLLKLPEEPDCPMSHAMAPMLAPSSANDTAPAPGTSSAIIPPAPVQTAAVATPPTITSAETPPSAAPAAPAAVAPSQVAVAPPPKPRKPAPHKASKSVTAALTPPAAAAAAPVTPPVKSEADAAALPAKPAAADISPPVKPQAAIVAPPPVTPAPSQAAVVPPVAPAPASGPPAAITPTPAKGR